MSCKIPGSQKNKPRESSSDFLDRLLRAFVVECSHFLGVVPSV